MTIHDCLLALQRKQGYDPPKHVLVFLIALFSLSSFSHPSFLVAGNARMTSLLRFTPAYVCSFYDFYLLVPHFYVCDARHSFYENDSAQAYHNSHPSFKLHLCIPQLVLVIHFLTAQLL